MPDTILGISISDRGVQAVEVLRNGLSATLLAIDEWPNPFSTGNGAISDERMQQFEDTLSAFLKVNRIKSTRVSLALDTSYLFVHRIPVEEKTTEAQIREQVRWEIEQYFPESHGGDFISDFHRMKRSPAEPLNEVLTVSLRRSAAQYLARSLTGLGLQLHILDADHFSAETALRINYPDMFRRTLALLGIKENRLDISLLRNGNLESYSYRVVQSNQEIIEEVGTISRETPGIFSITAYGPYLEKDLLQRIRRSSALLVEALNPLRHVSVSDSLRLADHLTAPSYRFASAVGVALRRE
jgi:Tfp pilus assembly PilM family ATPase